MIDISKITIPQNPGIYLMKDSDEKIIYIGKAKNLKNRVRSYFNKNQNYIVLAPYESLQKNKKWC